MFVCYNHLGNVLASHNGRPEFVLQPFRLRLGESTSTTSDDERDVATTATQISQQFKFWNRKRNGPVGEVDDLPSGGASHISFSAVPEKFQVILFSKDEQVLGNDHLSWMFRRVESTSLATKEADDGRAG